MLVSKFPRKPSVCYGSLSPRQKMLPTQPKSIQTSATSFSLHRPFRIFPPLPAAILRLRLPPNGSSSYSYAYPTAHHGCLRKSPHQVRQSDPRSRPHRYVVALFSFGLITVSVRLGDNIYMAEGLGLSGTLVTTNKQWSQRIPEVESWEEVRRKDRLKRET